MATGGHGTEIFGIASIAPVTPESGCAPYPWSTMRALGSGDAVITLRVEEGTSVGPPSSASFRPHQISDMHEVAARQLPGGCGVAGVRQWSATFQEHERAYTVFVAVRGDFTQRRDEAQLIWKSLQLAPIVKPEGDARIGKPYWLELLTHCGIDRAFFNGREWVADPAVTATSGWTGPFEVGLMTLIDDGHARFTSRDGIRTATFRPRTAADRDAPPCG